MHENSSKVLAIIPARGGSKGIPHKNIALLHGKPLLAYTLEHALRASAITRTAVSTDDLQIAIIAEQHGAEVIWRPPEISGDTATSESALLHALDQLDAMEGYRPDLVVFLQCTAPLRHEDDIDRAIQTLIDEQADSLFSLAPFRHFLWHVKDGKLVSSNFDYLKRPRSQELPPIYMENGSIYVFKPWVLRQFGNRLGGKIAHYVMDPLSSVDIDTPGDLALCEAIMQSAWQECHLT